MAFNAGLQVFQDLCTRYKQKISKSFEKNCKDRLANKNQFSANASNRAIKLKKNSISPKKNG